MITIVTTCFAYQQEEMLIFFSVGSFSVLVFQWCCWWSNINQNSTLYTYKYTQLLNNKQKMQCNQTYLIWIVISLLMIISIIIIGGNLCSNVEWIVLVSSKPQYMNCTDSSHNEYSFHYLTILVWLMMEN